MAINTAVWIWTDEEAKKNTVRAFRQAFSLKTIGKVMLCLAAETDYVAYVNGAVAGYGAFAGYRDEKYYDCLDITSLCRTGKNELAVSVRYEGVNSSTHIDDGAGLCFCVEADGLTVAESGTQTEGGADGKYIEGQERHITGQLGLTLGMQFDVGTVYKPCRIIPRTCRLLPRPVPLLRELPPCPGISLAVEGHRIYDLGKETAGYVYLSLACEQDETVQLRYGEHLADGCVRSRIGNRDFSLDFACRKGENQFCQRFVRVAGRYLEIVATEKVSVKAIGLVPVEVPIEESGVRDRLHLTALDRQIYDTCLATLRLCMHTHYEDCPWREQALYVLDSRNQMLCGYDAFRDASFARANLVFISKGKRPEDGMLELTYPAVHTPAIPFFSVMYPVAVAEYVAHTGDQTILAEVFPTVRHIMETVAARVDATGLVPNFPVPYWNFYEWSCGSDGAGELGNPAPRTPKYDLILNAAFVYANSYYRTLCQMTGTPYLDTQSVKKAIEKTFYLPQSGAFRLSDREDSPVSQLGCAFARLIGLGDARTLAYVRGEAEAVPATLSMRGFVYDAVLAAEESEEAIAYILQDIRSRYGKMLDAGATSFWETEEGQSAFGNAGSLCHGWSALPIHYFVRFL